MFDLDKFTSVPVNVEIRNGDSVDEKQEATSKAEYEMTDQEWHLELGGFDESFTYDSVKSFTVRWPDTSELENILFVLDHRYLINRLHANGKYVGCSYEHWPIGDLDTDQLKEYAKSLFMADSNDQVYVRRPNGFVLCGEKRRKEREENECNAARRYWFNTTARYFS